MNDAVLRCSRTLQSLVLLLLVLLAEWPAVGQALSAPCAPTPGGAVSWWRGENDAQDIFGSNPAATNAWVRFAPGQVGQAILFNGTNSAVTVPNSDSLNFGPATSFTIEAWIRVERTVSKYALSIIDKRLAPAVFEGVPLNAAVGYTLFLVDGRLGLQLSDVPLANSRFHDFYSLGSDLRDGRFHHVAAVIDRASAGSSSLFVDGEVVLRFDATVVSGDLSNSEPLRIGYHASPGFDGFFDGQIDEVGLYRRALTAAELETIYQAGSNGRCQPEAPEDSGPARITLQPQSQIAGLGGPALFSPEVQGATPLVYQWWHDQKPVGAGTNRVLELSAVRRDDSGTYVLTVSNAFGATASAPALLAVDPSDGPVAYWSFDESSGTVAHDAIGHLDGQLLAGAVFVPDGVSGGALKLDRSSHSYVTLGNNFGFENATFSIVGWIRTEPGDTSENDLVLAKHEAGYANGYFIVVNRSNPVLGQPNKLTLFAGDAFTGPTSVTTVNDGNWHQFAAIHEHDGNNRIYVDGHLESSVPGLPVAPSPAPWIIGGASFDQNPQGLFRGLIDELQIYSRALDTDEVAALFLHPTQAGSGGMVFRRDLPANYSPGTPVTVKLSLSARPTSNLAQAYTLEETVPEGWSVLDLSPAGSYDAARHTILFGLFTNANAPTLSYSIKPPLREDAIRFFQGVVIANGKEKVVRGPASIAPSLRPGAAPPRGTALRLVPNPTAFGEEFTVNISVQPNPLVSAYAVEEQVATGLVITNITENGTYHSEQHIIRWGPFFDSIPRMLNYQVSDVRPSFADIPFSGVVSFDGGTESILGANVIRPGIRLVSPSQTLDHKFQFSIPNAGLEFYRIGVSTNLRTWTFLTLTNTGGTIRIDDAAISNSAQRFFRLSNE